MIEFKFMIKLTQTPRWTALQQHYQEIENLHMRDLFLNDRERSTQFCLEAAGICLDYSKNQITSQTMKLLCDLARQRNVASQIESLFNGEAVNSTENNAALHTALRNLGGKAVYVNGRDVMTDIKSAWLQMEKWITAVRSGKYKGYSGKTFRDIVNIGVGGSDLGPSMVYHALKPYVQKSIRCHFISNQDEFHANEILERLNPETTLFIITSKSFTTKETIDNANLTKRWLLTSTQNKDAVKKHFVAVTAQTKKALDYDIVAESIFPLWQWVGGRYSIWSTVGLPVAIAIGMRNFKDFLAGAHAMDQHFRSAKYAANMPIILALLTIWYNNFFHAQSRAIIPYSQQLSYLPDYLKQLYMESQGKTTQRDASPVDYATGSIIWGGVGSNSQHSFHQLFLQGNQLSPIDFILPVKSYRDDRCQYELIANCLSQSETLMQGYPIEQVIQDLRDQGLSQQAAETLAPHKMISGNYPSNTILLEKITPYTLAALLALYEHKVYVQSLIWNINAFDQWGVERGKTNASDVLQSLQQGILNKQHDESTQNLIKRVLKFVEKED